MSERVYKAITFSYSILRQHGKMRYYRRRLLQTFRKIIPKVTRNRYKPSSLVFSRRKVTAFHPVSSRDLISIISEFQIDEIKCILHFQQMYMLLFSSNYSFNNISSLKITLHCIYIQRPPRNSCNKKCLN